WTARVKLVFRTKKAVPLMANAEWSIRADPTRPDHSEKGHNDRLGWGGERGDLFPREKRGVLQSSCRRGETPQKPRKSSRLSQSKEPRLEPVAAAPSLGLFPKTTQALKPPAARPAAASGSRQRPANQCPSGQARKAPASEWCHRRRGRPVASP